MNKRHWLFLVQIIAFTAPCFARNETMEISQPALMESTVKVPLRNAPPSSYFYRKGEQVGFINEGEKVIATDEKTVQTLFGDYRWVKVRRIDTETGKEGQEGWVYFGEEKGVPYFSPASIEKPKLK